MKRQTWWSVSRQAWKWIEYRHWLKALTCPLTRRWLHLGQMQPRWIKNRFKTWLSKVYLKESLSRSSVKSVRNHRHSELCIYFKPCDIWAQIDFSSFKDWFDLGCLVTLVLHVGRHDDQTYQCHLLRIDAQSYLQFMLTAWHRRERMIARPLRHRLKPTYCFCRMLFPKIVLLRNKFLLQTLSSLSLPWLRCCRQPSQKPSNSINTP